MREIKFRAWWPEQNKMIPVEEIRFFNSRSQPYMVFGDYGERIMDGFGQFSPEHLMQFTGLKDKDGVEIYEGDILHHETWRVPLIAEWSDRGFVAAPADPEYRHKTRSLADLCGHIGSGEIVIGNIHENPELLK